VLTFDVSGFARLTTKIRGSAALLDTTATTAVTGAARALVEEAKSRVPVKEGILKDSIHISNYWGLSADVTVDALNESGIPYGGFVEYGTSFTPAQPFMGPAAQATEPKFQRLMEAAVVQAMGPLAA
jgi:HK97 gp10 family phage protein